MKVQVLDDNGEIRWQHNMQITSVHDPTWRGASKPYLTEFHIIIDALSVAKNQASKDEIHLMAKHLDHIRSEYHKNKNKNKKDMKNEN